MPALSHDQRFLLLLFIGLFSGAWLICGTTAQTFTAEDRTSILKFMDVFMNFLDAESDNATSTESPINATTTDNEDSTTVASNSSTTESTEEESSTASSSSSSSNGSTEPTSDSTTLAANATSPSSSTDTSSSTVSSSSSTTELSTAPTRRRICFKRVCYKFINDKGYIY